MANSRSSKPKRNNGQAPLVDGGSLSRAEIIAILEDLAENGGATARISAIRELRNIKQMDEEAGAQKPGKGGFDELDDDLAQRRQQRASA